MTQQRTQQVPKAYDPKGVEERLYEFWMERGYFTPQVQSDKEPFVVIMPPPNVTGELHLGHAITASIEDALARWHRMLGDPTLWLPGADHAGIATQVVVERGLTREGTSRHELGREAFVQRVWEWVHRYGNTIDEQHKRLGASCDWTRRRFTLDEGPSRAVRTTFVNLYRKGLIYRGERIVNWCSRCSTALSDLEVDHEEEQDHLWYIRYLRADGHGHVTVATTRPETMLGDTGVAVNPGDSRYRDIVGSRVVLPLLNRRIPVVGDDAVETRFGTGALKITPGHDPADFEIGQRHGLPIVNVIDPDARMSDEAGPYQGLDRYDAREAVLRDLEQAGLLERVEDMTHSVGHCQRCNTIVEPLVSKQWFVHTQPLAEPAIRAIQEGEIQIVPERFTRVYLNWMENIRDWCISRQLWWGHRIPAWFCAQCHGDKITLVLSGERGNRATDFSFIPREVNTLKQFLEEGKTLPELDSRVASAYIDIDVTPIVSPDTPSSCPQCGSTKLFQDPDVLDTWFSSGLWPHSTLGWPDDTEDLRYFYPTTVMETGYDILFFWVARMIMMGIENTGRVPFRTVFLHGLVRDPKGRKMSKTEGNVVDPLDMIDRYGTDALRFALTTGITPGNDTRISDGKVESARNFSNKIWNAARFVMLNLEEAAEDELRGWSEPRPRHREDRWIVSRLHRLALQVDRLMRQFQIGEAEREIYEFIWNEYCDWYIELAKVRLRQDDREPLRVLAYVLERVLRLLHPFMPFVTEETWQNLVQRLPHEGALPESIVIALYPTGDGTLLDDEAESEMQMVVEVVRGIRNLRAEFHIAPQEPVEALIDTHELHEAVQEETTAIKALARVELLQVVSGYTGLTAARNSVTFVSGRASVMVPLEGIVDLAKERERLEKELHECLSTIRRLEQRLQDHQFLGKAPEEVIERERQRLADTGKRRERIEELLEHLKP